MPISRLQWGNKPTADQIGGILNLNHLARDYFILKAEAEQMKQERANVARAYITAANFRRAATQTTRDLLNLYSRKIKATEDNLATVEDAIRSIKDRETRELLQLLFIEGQTIEAAADKIYISISTANRKKADGMRLLANYRPIRKRPAERATG